MYDRGLTFTALGVLALLGAFPILWLLVNGGGGEPPELAQPRDTAGCVESVDYMRRAHMDLLETWRNTVVRDGQRSFTTEDGREMEMSLTGTCLACHGPKDEFCGKCHDYSGVKPDCWHCHLDVEGGL